MEMLKENFDAPIPGMSLTAELGGRPWQNPPMYPTVEAAIDYYVTRMSTDAFELQLLDILEMGIPVTSIVEVMQMNGVMEGLHSVDVGILISPVLIEFIMLVGDSAGIKYNTGMETEEEEGLRPSAITKALGKFKKAMAEGEEEEPTPEPEPVEEETEEPVGLMARRT